MQFVEDLLGAAASLEISSENPAAWKCMRAAMRADGKTSHLRCDLVETVGLEGTKDTEVDSNTQVDQIRKPWLRQPPGGDQNDLAVLSGSKFLNDLVQQGKWRKHVHRPSLPSACSWTGILLSH